MLSGAASERLPQIHPVRIRRPDLHHGGPRSPRRRPWLGIGESDRARPGTVLGKAVAENMTKPDMHRVVFERDDNDRWFVHCPDVPGAHSHGRTLASARSNIREAIGLVLDIPDGSSIELAEEIQLGDPILQESVEQARQLRHRANGIEQQTRTATVAAIERSAVSDTTLSMRDLADLLGLSHQRVQQISASGTLR